MQTKHATMSKGVVDFLMSVKHDAKEMLKVNEFDDLKFILWTNIGEGEGTQNEISLKKSLEKQPGANDWNTEDQVNHNILDALNHMRQINCESTEQNKGLLDIEECIQKTHSILMKGLLKSSKLGVFSIEKRLTINKDKIHVFPQFESTEEAFDNLQIIIDNYNSTIEFIKNSSEVDKISLYFRCAAWLFHNFVALHPFSDGNGRLGRILVSYCLNIMFPFPCTFVATRNDYMKAVTIAQETKDIGPLVTILQSGHQM
jgi:Fic family protein